MRDIAKQANVSLATVSRVLNNDHTLKVTDATRKRVIDIANKLNYQTNQKTRKPRKQKANQKLSVAVINTFDTQRDLNDPYFNSILEGLTTEAQKWNMRFEKVFRLKDANKNWAELEAYGAVIIIGNVTREVIEKIHDYNPNVVVLDETRPLEDYDIVHNDFSYQMRQVLERLYANGHRRISFIGADVDLYDLNGEVVANYDDVRKKVYDEWMRQMHLDEYLDINLSGWDTLSAITLTEEIIKRPSAPSAIVAASDPIAIGVYRGLQKNNLVIGQDVVVVSFDDIEFAQYLTPPLATVRPETIEMGKGALRLARERILGERTLPVELIIPSKLQARASLGDDSYKQFNGK